jgi:hypothetical protein
VSVDHILDRMGICRKCGQGITAREIVDGTQECSGRDPYADCICNHGRHTHAQYTGACGLCDCPYVREAYPSTSPTGSES